VLSVEDFLNENSQNNLSNNPQSNIGQMIADLLMDKYTKSVRWEEKLNMELPTEKDLLKKLIPENILRLKLYQIMQLAKENEIALNNAKTEEEQDDCLTIGLYLERQRKQITQQLKIDIFHK
jgi:hypothetical protein